MKILDELEAKNSAKTAALDALRRANPAASAAADAWGRRVRYERLSDDAFRLTSAGPDGAFGTADDIAKDY